MHTLSLLLLYTLLVIDLLVDGSQSARIIEFGTKLSEYVDLHQDKGFLVKFYAPWCHHCQQLEPAYKNMAEDLYQRHDDLIIGQVDCTQSRSQCDKYGVQAFPEIVYITKKQKIKYEGNRSVESMINFANRVHGPDVNRLVSCKQINEVTDKHGVIFISNIKSSSSRLRQDYEAVAGKLKSRGWFYQIDGNCDNLKSEGLYSLKQHLDKAIKFDETVNDSQPSASDDNQRSIERWIDMESFPIYGQLLSSNLNRMLSSNKNLVVALLDFYHQASKFTRSSYELHKAFGRYARKHVQTSDDFRFAWTSDLNLIETIALQSVIVPNIIIIKPDLSYHLLIKDQTELPDKPDKILPEKLKDYRLIEEVLDKVKSGSSIDFSGGNGYVHTSLRMIFGQYMKFRNVYKSEPILVTIIMALPTTIFIYILYTIFSEQRHTSDDYERLPREYNQCIVHPDGDQISSAKDGAEDKLIDGEDDDESDDNSHTDDDSDGASTRSSQLSDDFEPIDLPDDADYKDAQPANRMKID